MLTLAVIAALPTLLVVVVQERSLVRDLEEAAGRRLDRAARAAGGLLDGHLAALTERYRAISGTPQFRATLELDDRATLEFYAGELARREGAVAVGFVAQGAPAAGGPEPGLLGAALADPAAELGRVDGRSFAYIRVDLERAGRSLGRLVAVEELDAARLASWSETCGAAISLVPEGVSHDGGAPFRTARSLGGVELRVHGDLGAEQLAIANARRSLVVAGLGALLLASTLGWVLSRAWVRPIRALKDAADMIGDGQLDPQLDLARQDEFGDVSRAFHAMTGRLRAYRARVGEQQRALEAHVAELRRSEQHLRNAHRIARMGGWRFDPDTLEVEVSAELRGILELRRSGPAGYGLKDLLERVHPDDRPHLVDAARLALSESSSLHLDHRVVLGDGSERVLQTQAHVIRGEDGSRRLDGTSQDVTERKRVEEQIRFLAFHDALTGLGNRRRLEENLDRALGRSQARVGVLFLDLDHFKRINDTLGHSVGDRLLQGVAGRLVAVAGAGRVSRFGGDEFAILLDDADDEELGRMAERLSSELARPYSLSGHDIVITASQGSAFAPRDGRDRESLLRNADTAMYAAKQRGRNVHERYTASMNEAALSRLRLEVRLRQAIEADALDVHLQPKLDGSGGEILGLEALVRWNDDELGPQPPAAFIPVAEDSGLIGRLGEQVLRKACREAARLPALGLPAVPISVNLSMHQFRGDGLVETVRTVLEESGLDPARLELEITESMLMQEEERVIGTLADLRALGVSTSVDDFGTGYSSLAYLGRLPVDALKIDRSFVTGIADSEDEAALARAIVSMGHALHLRVVAEGVETETQRRLLAGWGADELQGFLFAKPMPSDRLAAWYAALREGRPPTAPGA